MIDTMEQYFKMDNPKFKDKTSQSIDGSFLLNSFLFYFIKLIIPCFKFAYLFNIINFFV